MRVNPHVSVIVPTYNRAAELSRSIKSVITQTYTNFELLIIDDASTDETAKVVAAFSDERIRYERLTTNVGGAEARNIGVQLARGAVIAFQDSDDEWLCDKLSKSVTKLEEDEFLGAVCSTYIKVGVNSCVLMPNRSGFDPDNVYTSLLWANVVGTPTLVVRKKVIESVGGFNASLPRYQDWDLAIKLSKITNVQLIDEPLVIAYATSGSISSSVSGHKCAIEMIYEKNISSISDDKLLANEWRHKIGDARMRANDITGRGLLWKSFFARPTRFKYFALAVCSLLGNSRFYNKAVNFAFKLKTG